MCYQMIAIATYDDRYFISQCEHGTLHLTWGRMVLSFHPEEFQEIASTLTSYKITSRTTLITQHVALAWHEENLVQVWLARVGLWLESAGFAILLALITQASQNVKTPSSALLDQYDLMCEPGYYPIDVPN